KSAVKRCRLSSPNPRSTLANLNEGPIMTVVKSALRYSAEHEWLNDEDPVRIGITDYAADQLGDVVFAELPEVVDSVTAGEVCGELESTKSVSELYSPLTGTIVKSNDDVIYNPVHTRE